MLQHASPATSRRGLSGPRDRRGRSAGLENASLEPLGIERVVFGRVVAAAASDPGCAPRRAGQALQRKWRRAIEHQWRRATAPGPHVL